MAAFIHVASELAFILNSARLLPRRADTGADQELPAPGDAPNVLLDLPRRLVRVRSETDVKNAKPPRSDGTT